MRVGRDGPVCLFFFQLEGEVGLNAQLLCEAWVFLRLGEVGGGFVVGAVLAVDGSAVEVGQPKIRIERDRFVVIGQRAALIAFVLPSLTAPVVGFGVARINFNRFVEISDGAWQVAFL